MLRGLAVLLVLFRHHPASGPLNHIGWIGLDLFFVLSGFLVSGLIFDEYRSTGSFKAFRFLVRRGFKIYPSFYAFFLVTIALKLITGRDLLPIKILAEVFFFQNYHEGLWVNTWSLAVEEHFYFLLAFTVLLIISSRIRPSFVQFFVWSVVLFSVCLGLRIWTHMNFGFSPWTHVFRTHLRIDSLFAGVLLAAVHRYRPEHFRWAFRDHRMIVAGIAAVCLTPVIVCDFESIWLGTVGFTLLFVACGLVVGMAVASDEQRGTAEHRASMFVRLMARLGRISYTVYLWHLLVLVFVELVLQRAGLGGTLVELVVFVLASTVVGWLASWAIERPGLRLRERWIPATHPPDRRA
jgi:peptidoglycan/LPS O-acetylase OafA/YrhL